MIEAFEQAQSHIRTLDFRGLDRNSDEMRNQYLVRNVFGLDPDRAIHRIFQQQYLCEDQAQGVLTLPRACSNLWNDPLENPLSKVKDFDSVADGTIELGRLVSSFHAHCWTLRDLWPGDWQAFSHGQPAIRISTTVGKLMERVMLKSDPAYMHRHWLVEVQYKEEEFIEAMQNPREVYRRLTSTGAMLALSAAIVRSDHAHEDEARFLYDAGVNPPQEGVIVEPNVVRIPFDWEGFIDHEEYGP